MILNKKIPILFRFNEIRTQLFIVIFISIFCDYIPDIYKKLDQYFSVGELPEIPITIATILGTAISILLSFRVNQSFSWWWEARQIWGAIINDSRSYTLQLQMYTEDDNDIKKIALRQSAWAYALSKHLRKQNPLEIDNSLISADDIDKIRHHKNIPLAILSLQNEDIKQLFANGKINEFALKQLTETQQRFTDSLGKCERIKNTVFPKMSSEVLIAIIYLFAISLSIPLKLNLVMEIIIITTTTMVFVTLEKSAERLEKPFENLPNDVPMTSLCETIEINTKQLLNENNFTEAEKKESFYVL